MSGNEASQYQRYTRPKKSTATMHVPNGKTAVG
jgi:hypothetical protein